MKNMNIFLLIIVMIITLSWLPFLDEYGDHYTTESLTHAAATYGVARGINAVVSVIQSTQVSIGVASISPGEFLDPFNDLVERFSWIIMLAMASIGLQKLLLTIASSLLFKMMITLTGTLLIISILRKSVRIHNALIRLFVIALFLRFAVGAVVFANDMVEEFFLEEQKKESTVTLTETKDSLTDLSLNIQKDKESLSWWQDIKDTFTSLTNDNEQRIQQQTEKASHSIINLIVVYVAQTILFPILFIWIFYKMMLWVWSYNWAGVIRPEIANRSLEIPEVKAEGIKS